MRLEDILAPKVNKVQLVDRLGSESNTVGAIHITTSHVIFRADDTAKEIWIPNALIGSVEKGSLSVVGTPLTIRCKHFLTLNLLIGKDRECQSLYETLLKCGRPVNIVDVFAFEIRDWNGDLKSKSKKRGWERFSWEIEFARQGIGTADKQMWKISDFNIGYRYCDTYPERLCVPSSANMQILIGSCKFRSRARLPVLTYWHRPNSASISRCAQPLTGFSARCVEDEQLMSLIAKVNQNYQYLCLIDTRPVVNAVVNRMQGKGYEDVKNYPNMRFHFFDIENIHVMRSSLNKLLDACQRTKTVTDYYKQLENSGWLRHIRSLLDCGVFLANLIDRGVSAVVHCSDGWDRTSQTVSIAQLLLDPFYRTIRGFQILTEKDWLGFGHKFDDRCGHVGALNDEAAKEVAPIFTQFFDCVYQIMRLQPRAFEFNERYLIDIHEHVYSCQFGTFLGNCDKDRKDLNLSERTLSLWAFIDDHQDDYINPLFEDNKFSVLSPIDLHPSAIVVWTTMYNRFDTGLLPRESTTDVTMSTLEHVGVLETEIVSLQAKLALLKAELSKGAVCGETMIDSGHSSTLSSLEPQSTTSAEPSTMQEQKKVRGVSGSWETIESGVYDSPCSSSLFDCKSSSALHWQSLRSADGCSSRNCGAEFSTRLERRFHCYRCGLIYCRRCVKVSSDQRDRICSTCAA